MSDADVITALQAGDEAAFVELVDRRGTNQRVLLHRARSKVRQALEDYSEDGLVAAFRGDSFRGR